MLADVDANDVEEKCVMGAMEDTTHDVHTYEEHGSILIVDSDYDIISVDGFLDNTGTVSNMAHEGNDNLMSERILRHDGTNDNIETSIIYLSDDDYKSDMLSDSIGEDVDQLHPLFKPRLTRLSSNVGQILSTAPFTPHLLLSRLTCLLIIFLLLLFFFTYYPRRNNLIRNAFTSQLPQPIRYPIHLSYSHLFSQSILQINPVQLSQSTKMYQLR